MKPKKIKAQTRRAWGFLDDGRLRAEAFESRGVALDCQMWDHWKVVRITITYTPLPPKPKRTAKVKR